MRRRAFAAPSVASIALADVTAVNTKRKTVTLRGPKRTVELKVRDPEQFKLIKVGDQAEPHAR